MTFSKRLLALPLLVVLLLGQGCSKGPSPEARSLSQRVTLKVWGVVDDLDAYRTTFDAFRKKYPFVTIQFKRFRLEEYEEELLNAMAEGQGPDLFLIHNTWTDKYLTKILPSPKNVKSAVQLTAGSGVNQQATFEVRTTNLVSPGGMRNEFADFVAHDAVRNVDVSTTPNKKQLEDRVMAIPMSSDTLALYYNKDLLNAAGIPVPPEGWDTFQAQATRLTRQGADGAITRSGSGIGLGSNVERSPDVLALLMMQNRAVMTNEDGSPAFARAVRNADGEQTDAGFEALRFYSDFANPSKEAYSWNAAQPNSLDAFIQGTSAFFLGYAYQLPTIRARAPKLNLGITKAPQITGNAEVNFANYWMWTVSKRSVHGDLSWLLANQLASTETLGPYLEVVKRPAARKSLLSGQLELEDVGVFASQVLTARTWYKGKDPRAADQALIELMDAAPAAADERALRNLLRTAEEKVAQTVR